MKTFVISRAILLLAFSATIASATVIPQSSCTFDNTGGVGNSGGFHCNLYPSNPDGSLNDNVSYTLTSLLPTYSVSNDALTTGIVVIVDPGLDPTDPTVQANQADWLQVLEFQPASQNVAATSIQLLTLGCNNASNPSDTSCFPSLTTVNGANSYFYVEPSATPAYSTPYNYSPGDVKDHQYNVYFFPETPVTGTAPEPASIATFSAGLVAVGLLRRKFRSRNAS